MRDTIFISHATPENDEFTIWLASRLELLGYKVWVDKTQLLGGEVFWEDIEDTLKNKAIKILLVYSDKIIDKNHRGKMKSGIQKEIDLSFEVSNSNPELKDFLIILNIDKSPFNLFEGSENLNQIPFNKNWADGLGVLLKKLQKDSVPLINANNTSSFSEWYLDHYLIKNPVIEKKELYYTNWWSVEEMPKQFYIFKFANKEQAEKVYAANKSVLATLSANCISSFDRNLTFQTLHNNEELRIEPNAIYDIKLSELLLDYEKEAFPTRRDAENYFKKLIQRAIHLLFKKNNLRWYELSNEKLAYYHTTISLPSSKVSFAFPYRSSTAKLKKKNLFGKYLTIGKWHFAISVKPILSPYLGFSVKSHLVFTTDGIYTLGDKEQIHSYRRKKGKRMFNEEWRNLLLAFISSIKDSDGTIGINVSNTAKFIMKKNVELFWSDFGYIDPKDSMRQSIFTYEEENEDEPIIDIP